MSTRQTLWAVIGISTAVRLVFALSLGGLTDEAYYALYARHLDWAFFDHPPMVGVVAAIGEALAGWINPVIGLRFGFVLMFAGSSWLLARLTERFFGLRAAVLAVLVLNTTIFYGIVVGTLAGPDGPLLFFWLLTLERLAAAFDGEGRNWTWVGVGIAWGGAMLSKYHAVLLPAGTLLYLVLRPSARRCLKTPGPYLASLVGCVVFAPVVLWNASHGWASFLFQGTRSGGFKGFRPDYLMEAVVGQIFYLLPGIWLWLMVIAVGLIRRGPRRWTNAEAFLLCQALPAQCLFLGVASYSQILTHWPLIGFIALMPMLGRDLPHYLDTQPRLIRPLIALCLATPIVFAGLFLAQANFGLFQDSKGRLAGVISPQDDLTVDTILWDQVATELKLRGISDTPNTFLFTCNWRYSAELSLATRHELPVACYHRDARSFSFWSRPEDYLGRDGIFIRTGQGVAEDTYFAPWFRQIERLPDIPIVRAGFPMQTVRVFRCKNQISPYPFGYTGRGPIPRPGSAQLGLVSPQTATR